MNVRQTEARRWFSQARADLAVVHTLVGAGHYAAACFHAQQAAEKALKAVLFSQGSRVIWGHSVAELAKQCSVHEPSFADLAAEAAQLDQFYIPTRYPHGLPSPAVPSETYTAAQAEMASASVERIIDLAETFLRRQGVI
ncbi:MAG: HEPN domain-containing protein [Anaerolineae bacterium]|nr:HEPN domain-containing protein [Anaerolineae bacterium]